MSSTNPVNGGAIAQDLVPQSLGSCAAATQPAGLVHFYHLTTTPLERALPKLLEKAYGAGFRTIVVAEEARIARLDEALWTYDPNSFLPHGTEADGNIEKQPIVLTTSPTQGGEKVILCITNGHYLDQTEGYARVLDVFDGGNEESLAAARARWKRYKDAGAELHYYQQTTTGGWEKK